MIFYKIIFFVYVSFLFYWGMRKRPSFSSWHMFANLNMMHFDLFCKHHGQSEELWKRLEPFEYLPHTHLSMSQNELKVFLVFLGKVKNLEVKGECRYFFNDQEFLIRIEKNRIIND